MNTWMNNPQYLAQVGHTLGGFSLVVATSLLCAVQGWSDAWLLVWVTFGGLVAAALKEFWYDMRYELPRQSWGDSGMDFGFYVLGMGVGWVYLAAIGALSLTRL